MRKLLAVLALSTIILTGCDLPGIKSTKATPSPGDGEPVAATTTTSTTVPEPEVIKVYPTQAEIEEIYLTQVMNVQWPVAQSEDVLLRFGYAACDKLANGVYPGQWIYEKGGALEIYGLKRDKVMDLAYVIGVAHATLCAPELPSQRVPVETSSMVETR